MVNAHQAHPMELQEQEKKNELHFFILLQTNCRRKQTCRGQESINLSCEIYSRRFRLHSGTRVVLSPLKYCLLRLCVCWLIGTFSREADTFGAEVLKDITKNRLAFDDNKSWFVDVIMQILVDHEGCIILCVTALVLMFI